MSGTDPGGDAEERFRRGVEAASALDGAGRWEQAGVAWVEAARVAVDARVLAAARQCLHAAAESFRRDDRLAAAERALQTLLSLGPDPVQAAVARIHLAAVRADRGDRDGAEAMRPADAPEAPAPVRAVGIDVAVGIAWQWGAIEEVRALVARLEAVEGSDGPGVAFRRAQLRRADGDLEGADAALSALVAPDRATTAAGRAIAAAVAAERAEIALLAGRPEEALSGYGEAARAHTEAGRRSLAWRAEAGRVGAAVAAGMPVITRLDEGVAYAASRGLVPLGIALATALGESLAARDPAAAAVRLEEAVAAAEQVGMHRAAGRARIALALHTRQAPDRRAAMLVRAAQDLADDVPWRDRALAAL